MISIVPSQSTKPNRVATPETGKDAKYHRDYARYVASNCVNGKYSKFLKEYNVNRRFYKNDQWWVEEDKASFLMDESGETNNRIQVTRNFIQPMVEQYRGNADRMQFTSKIISLSPLVKSKREEYLNRLLVYNDVAKTSPGFGQFIRKEFPNIGATEQETVATFENLFTDTYIKSLNHLLLNVRAMNNMDQFKKMLAQDMALSGMGIMKPYFHSGHQRFKRVAPDCFGWDPDARMYSLVDAQMFTEQYFYPLSELAEMFQLDGDVLRALEKFLSVAVVNGPSGSYNTSGRIPVQESVWKDMVVDWFGYVYDRFGQVVLRRINDESQPEEERVKESDLIPYSKLTDYQKKVLKNGGVNRARLTVDMWRYCIFIPAEIAGISSARGGIGDIVLEYGAMPYQEPDLYQPTNMVVPYKVGIWLFDDGEVIAPVSVAINPQRMINRFLSILENQLNNSGGSGPVFDAAMFDTTDAQTEAVRSVKQGKPIMLNSRGMGVQNAVGTYNATVKENTLILSNLIQNYKLGMNETTGVTDAMQGNMAPDQLVGLVQLSLQRGSILQQPFYGALQSIFQGCDQAIVTSGKRLYIDNEVELIDMVGSDGAATVKLAKEIRNESFRAYLKIGLDPDIERDQVDRAIFTYAQLGLLDEDRLSNLIGRASMEDVYAAVREFVKEKREMQRIKAAQDQVKLAQQAQESQRQENIILGESQAERSLKNTMDERSNTTKVATELIKKTQP